MTAVSHANSRTTASTDANRGVVYALLAYGLWGGTGLYFGALSHISPIEVIAHRAWWSVPIAVAALVGLGKLADLGPILGERRLLGRLLFTSLLLAANWWLFVWAVAADRTLETSLGYFINPLLNVLIGFTLLGERLTRAQTFAVGLAALAVALQTLMAGVLPWVALLLAGTFAAYGYLRKTVPVGPVQGFLVEAVVLSVIGIAATAWLIAHGTVRFGTNVADTLLLLGCGPVTAVPLMWFSAAARRIRFSTLGILQYIAPSGLFLTAVFAFGEPMDLWRLATFALIWTGLAIYSIDALRGERRSHATA